MNTLSTLYGANIVKYYASNLNSVFNSDQKSAYNSSSERITIGVFHGVSAFASRSTCSEADGMLSRSLVCRCSLRLGGRVARSASMGKFGLLIAAKYQRRSSKNFPLYG